MKSKEQLKTIRTKDVKTLTKELALEYEKLQKMRFSVRFRNLKDISQINKIKKHIARIYTVLQEKISISQSK